MKHQQRQHLRTVLFFVYTALAVVRSMALSTSATTKANRVIFHWFRHGDLRLHDNPALLFSSQESSPTCLVLPIFCYDSNIFGTDARTPTGSLKCGPKRAQFVRESVTDLRNSIRHRLGSELLVIHGEPATALSSLLAKFKESQVDIVMQDEVLKEERDTVRVMKRLLQQHGRGKVHTIWGSTMYERTDLPYAKDLSDMPDVFTPFRNKVEKKAKIQTPLSAPPKLNFPAKDSAAYKTIAEMIAFSPTLEDLGYTTQEVSEGLKTDARGVMEFRGGETAALQRVKEYIWDKNLLKDYFDTRNGMIGADYSTKLSPWLAHGCLSPRFVAEECKRYESTRVANKSTYWVVFELLWRDFCKFFADKHGDVVFFPGGTVGSDKPWPHYEKNFEAWKNGKTGYPLVDANMRELKATGFMSNRGRQNVASFLALDCNNDWRAGGDWFETHLLDYDVYSNWINWCAAAGMTGGRLNRFNTVKQSKDYDQHGDYIRLWLPELKDVPNEFVHEPWKMNQFQQKQFNLNLGVDYPNPLVPPPRFQSNKNKQRKPNSGGKNNRGQRYEMKSVKTGRYEMS